MPSTYWAKGVVILKSRRSSVVKRSIVGEEEGMREGNSENIPVKYRGINNIT